MLDVRDIIDSREASEVLQIHEETVRRLAREGKLPGFKVGGGWRFSRAALRDWMSSPGVRPSAPVVLVVDDEPTILHIVEHVLSQAGYAIVTATEGEEALSLLNEIIPGVILLDLHMPKGMNGAETIRELRRTHGQIPVIVMTGHPDSVLVSEALRHGPISLLSKPLDFGQLLTAVKMVCALPAAGTTERPG